MKLLQQRKNPMIKNAKRNSMGILLQASNTEEHQVIGKEEASDIGCWNAIIFHHIINF